MSTKDCLWASGLGVEVARLPPGIRTGLVMLEFMGEGREATHSIGDI